MDILTHPLFHSPVEANHKLTREGKKACHADAELCPGHGCCACCARSATITCFKCGRVQYCGSAHQEYDASHAKVCKILKAIAAAEKLELNAADVVSALDACNLTLESLREAGEEGWEAAVSEQVLYVPTEQIRVGDPGQEAAQGEKQVSLTVCEGDDGNGEHKQGGEEPSSGELGSSDAAAVVEAEQQISAVPTTTEREQADDHNKDDDDDEEEEEEEEEDDEVEEESAEEEEMDFDEGVDEEACLPHAVKLALAVSYLSYPATLAYALTGPRPLLPSQASSGSSTASKQALVLAILGASEDAELQHINIWKVLEGVAPQGLILQMIGPEVPADKHLTVQSLTSTIRIAYYKGEYNLLVDTIVSTVEHPSASFASFSPVAPLPASAPVPLTAAAAAGSVVVDTDKDKGLVATVSLPYGTAAASAATATTPATSSSPILPPELQVLPQALVGFNLGLTCPDYDWDTTLKSIKTLFELQCKDVQRTATGRVPVRLSWLNTANTQVEADMDEEFLREAGWKCVTYPHANPWASLEPLQSGTLANDVYRKSSWVSTHQLSAHVRGRSGVGMLARITRALGAGVQRATATILGRKRRLE